MRTTQRTDERILASDIFDRDDQRAPRPDHGFWDEPGQRIPIYHRGRQVGTRVRYDNRLVVAVLKHDASRLRALASSTKPNGSPVEFGDVP